MLASQVSPAVRVSSPAADRPRAENIDRYFPSMHFHPRVKRRRFFAGVAVSVVGLLSGCVDDIVGSPVSEPFSTDHTVSDETTVTVSNRNGPVTVQQADGDRVTVSGTKRASSQEALDSIDIDVVEGEQFMINVRFGSGSDFSNRNVALTVDIPTGVAVDRATTANGDVSVTGVRGDLTATTTNGDVDVADVSGFVRGETTNGDVQIRATTGLTRARTINGAVDVELHSMRDDVTCSSSNGDVTARVGPDVAAAIRLSTNTGTTAVRDLPYTTTVDRSGYIRGSLRDGESPVLHLQTNNGDVTLQPT